MVDNGSSGAAAGTGVRRGSSGPAATWASPAAPTPGVAEARAPILLILNPGRVPEEGRSTGCWKASPLIPEAAGLAPRLVGPDGRAAGRLAAPAPAVALAAACSRRFRCRSRARPRREPAGRRRRRAAGGGGAGPAARGPRRGSAASTRVSIPPGSRTWTSPGGSGDAGADAPLLAGGALPPRAGGHGAAARLRRPSSGSTTGTSARYLAKHHGRAWAPAARLRCSPGVVLRAPAAAAAPAAARGVAGRGVPRPARGAGAARSVGWRRPRRLRRRPSALHERPAAPVAVCIVTHDSRGRPAGLPGGGRRARAPAARDRGGRLRQPRRQPRGGAAPRSGRHPLPGRRRSARTSASRAA